MNNYPYISISGEDFLIPIASLKTLRNESLQTASTIIEALHKECENNIRSIILRGSVACGMEIPKHSDFDMMIFPITYFENQKTIVESLAANLSKTYRDTYSVIDLSLIDYKELFDYEINNRMILNAKLTGITLYGDDLISDIPNIKFDINLAGQISRQAIRETKQNLITLKNGLDKIFYMGVKRDTQFFCIWMMRVICRGLIAPVMTKKKVFTLNVEVAGKEYISLYPEHESIITQFLEWEKNPTGNPDILYDLVRNFISKYVEVCVLCKIALR